MRIVVTGLIAQHPALGGLTWHYLHYLIGLARAGHDVYYLEDSGQWPYTTDGGVTGDQWIAEDCRANLDYLRSVLDRFGLSDKWAYHFPTKPQWFGLSDTRRTEIIASADMLLNVSGSLEHPDRYLPSGRKVYLDTDPVFTQVRLERGEADFIPRVRAHDVHFTFGERITEAQAGYNWLPTRQPVVLSEWADSGAARNTFTTVMNWTSYEPLRHGGRSYGQKDAEFLRFLDLPARVAPLNLEIALSKIAHVDWATLGDDLPAPVRDLMRRRPDASPHQLLAAAGWAVADATEVCRDFEAYRGYVKASVAEWSIAKHGYVVGQPGWFSDRSACYLAAGRPVVLQNTGFDSVLPVGRGIIAFETIDEAVDGMREVSANPVAHSRAAREIAEQYFDSTKVLTSLIERAFSAPQDRGMSTLQPDK